MALNMRCLMRSRAFIAVGLLAALSACKGGGSAGRSPARGKQRITLTHPAGQPSAKTCFRLCDV